MPRTFRWNFFNFQIAPSFISLWRAEYIMATEYIWKMTITSHGVRSNKWRAMKAACVCVSVSCWVHLFIVYLLFGARGRVLLSIYKSVCVCWLVCCARVHGTIAPNCLLIRLHKQRMIHLRFGELCAFRRAQSSAFSSFSSYFGRASSSSIAVDANKQFND